MSAGRNECAYWVQLRFEQVTADNELYPFTANLLRSKVRPEACDGIGIGSMKDVVLDSGIFCDGAYSCKSAASAIAILLRDSKILIIPLAVLENCLSQPPSNHRKQVWLIRIAVRISLKQGAKVERGDGWRPVIAVFVDDERHEERLLDEELFADSDEHRTRAACMKRIGQLYVEIAVEYANQVWFSVIEFLGE